jgi:hypothetical protein
MCIGLELSLYDWRERETTLAPQGHEGLDFF